MSEALSRELEGRGIRDERVLGAMAAVPRGRFVPEHLRSRADADHPLPIGHGQTISQPFMVAWMTQALELCGDERVLEVGTGSGYQAAILGRLCASVLSVEIIPELAERARTVLASLGSSNVEVRLADGSRGVEGEPPFDRIIVTAAALRVPEPLLRQLAPGGRMVIPIGAPEEVQYLHLLTKGTEGAVVDRELFAVRFVPLRSAGDAGALHFAQ